MNFSHQQYELLIRTKRDSFILHLCSGRTDLAKAELDSIELLFNPRGLESGQERDQADKAYNAVVIPFQSLLSIAEQAPTTTPLTSSTTTDSSTSEQVSTQETPENDTHAKSIQPPPSPEAFATDILTSLKSLTADKVIPQILSSTSAVSDAQKKAMKATEQLERANAMIGDYRVLFLENENMNADKQAAHQELLPQARVLIEKAKENKCDSTSPGLSSYFFGKCALWQNGLTDALPLFEEALTQNLAHLPTLIKELDFFIQTSEVLTLPSFESDRDAIVAFLKKWLPQKSETTSILTNSETPPEPPQTTDSE